MILLNKIKLNNFLSHSNTEIELDKELKVLIDGNSGSGKSAIIDAIIWAFYNRSRSDNRSLIKHGSKIASVELDFSDEDKEYRIIRSITDKGKHELDLLTLKVKEWSPVEMSGKKNIQEYLESKILHSSYILFINSIAYPQDNVENFVKQTATKRKEIILEIIKASNYDEYYDIARDKLSEIKIKETELYTESIGLEKRIEEINPLVNDLERMINDVKGCKEMIKEYKDKIEKAEKIEIKNIQFRADIKAKKEQLDSLIVDPATFKQRKWELEMEINNFNKTDIESLVKDVAEYNGIVKELEIMEETRNRYDEWNRKKRLIIEPQVCDCENTIKMLNNKIAGLLISNLDKCPEINKECPILIKKKNEEISELSTKLIQTKDVHNQHIEYANQVKKNKEELGTEPTFDIELYQFKKNRLKELEVSKNEYAKFNNMQVVIDKKKEELCLIEGDIVRNSSAVDTLRSEIRVLESKIDPIIEEDKKNMVIQKETLEEKLNDLNASLALCKDADKNLKKLKSSYDNVTIKYKEILEDKDNLTLIKDAFSSTGVKNIIIDMVLPKLEEKINDILSKLSTFQIRLDTQRNNVDGDKVIEGLFITIINDTGNEMDLENYSGGEKTKIITAIAEGLASLQNFGFRLFDENIVGLDSGTIESFVEVVASIKDKFNQLICISHLQQVKDIFDNKINIIKTNGNSSIKE